MEPAMADMGQTTFTAPQVSTLGVQKIASVAGLEHPRSYGSQDCIEHHK